MDKHGALLRVVNVPGGAGRGGTAADEAATKTYVLLFPCPEGHPPPTEEEKAAAAAAAASAADEAKLRPATSEPTMLVRKGKRGDDDDDDDMFGLGGFGKKGGKRGGGLGLGGASGGGGGSGNFGGDDRVEGPMPPGLPWRLSSGGSDFLVAAVPADRVLAITDARIAVEPSAVLTPPSGATGAGAPRNPNPNPTPSPVAAAASSRALSDLSRALAAGAPASLDPVRDLKIGDVAAVEACHELARVVAAVPPLPPSVAPRLRAWNALLDARRTLGARVAELERGLSDANLQQMPDFEARVAVLQTMGYLDADRTVTLKGRVACEIATGDELVGTEVIFAGVLADVPAEEAVALLAALVFQEKNASPPELAGSLAEACERARELAFAAGEVQAAAGLPVAPDEYVDAALKFGLTEVVHLWAKGTKFADICQYTDVQEGSIVRTIVRLDEMCRDVRNAARIMGDSALYEKMEAASAAIKRDICFSASLYVAGTS